MLTNKTVNTANKTVMLTNKTVNTTNKLNPQEVETVLLPARPTLIKFKNLNGAGVVISGDGGNGGLGDDSTADAGNSSNNHVFIATLMPNLGSVRNLKTSEGHTAWVLTTDPTSGVSILAMEVLPQEGSKYVPAKFPNMEVSPGDSIEVLADSGVINSQVIGGVADEEFALTGGVWSFYEDQGAPRPAIDGRELFARLPEPKTRQATGGRLDNISDAYPYRQRPKDAQDPAFLGANLIRVRYGMESQNAVIDFPYANSLSGRPVFHKAGALAGFIAGPDSETGYAVMVDAYSFEKAFDETIKEFTRTYNSLFQAAPLDFVLDIDLVYKSFRKILALSNLWSGLVTVYNRDNNTLILADAPEAMDVNGNLVEPFEAGSVAFETLANKNSQLMTDIHQYAHKGVLIINRIASTDFKSGKVVEITGGTAGTPGSFQGALDTALVRCDPNKVIIIGGYWTINYQDDLAPEIKPVEYTFSPGITADEINGKLVKRQLIDAPSELRLDKPQFASYFPGTTFTSMDALRSAIIARRPGYGLERAPPPKTIVPSVII